MRRKTLLFLAVCFLVVFLTCGISQGIGEEKKPVTYRTEETWCQNGNKRIYGIAYIPDGDEKKPLVIFSHELGNCYSYSGMFQNSFLLCRRIAMYSVIQANKNRQEKKRSLQLRLCLPALGEEGTKQKKHAKNSAKRDDCQSSNQNAAGEKHR